MHIKSYDLVDPVNLEGLEPSSQRERLSLSLSLSLSAFWNEHSEL